MRLITEILLPLIAIISNPRQCFPSSRSPTEGSLSRRLLALRVLDLIILISQRIGYDQTRRFLNRPLQAFFRSFEIVHSESESWSQSSQGTVVYLLYFAGITIAYSLGVWNHSTFKLSFIFSVRKTEL